MFSVLYCSSERIVIYFVKVRNGLYDIESGCREIGHDISHGVSAGVFPAL